MKLQFFDGSFNFFDGIAHRSKVGLTETQAKEFARKNFGYEKYRLEKKIEEMRKIKPELVGTTKVWEIEL